MFTSAKDDYNIYLDYGSFLTRFNNCKGLDCLDFVNGANTCFYEQTKKRNITCEKQIGINYSPT